MKRGAHATVSRPLLILWAGGAAFSAYFSMYAFRKPFTASSYAATGDWAFEIDFKIALVIAQIAGYALSKVIGLKVIAEMEAHRRGVAILSLIGLSWAALILFALLPIPLKPLAMFLNGLPLGMIWGLVFGYLEGRRISDIVGAMLCASFIVSSGVVKSVGAWLMNDLGIADYWMPAATGALFMPLLLVSVLGLSRLPPPDPCDMAERTARVPMDGAERRRFVLTHWAALLPLVATYVIFTVIRDMRDNFSAEIWSELGFERVAVLFTATEAPIAFALLVVLGGFVTIRNSVIALAALNILVILGAALLFLSTLAFEHGMLPPVPWMILSGAGLYLAYTPFNALYFDRLIAAVGRAGNAGFLIYVADATGYLGSVALMIVKNVAHVSRDWLPFMISLNYWGAVLAMAMMMVVYDRQLRARGQAPDAPRQAL